MAVDLAMATECLRDGCRVTRNGRCPDCTHLRARLHAAEGLADSFTALGPYLWHKDECPYGEWLEHGGDCTVSCRCGFGSVYDEAAKALAAFRAGGGK
jgi:hypothetical protein